MKVIYDGWPLVYRPNGPAAIHLLTLLETHLDEAPVAACVALPGEPFERLPDGIEAVVERTPPDDAGRLRWEQRRLPEIARSCSAGLVHTTGPGLALFAAAPGVVSRTNFPSEPDRSRAAKRRSLAARLQEALAQGGLARATAQLWPDDLPAPESGPPLKRLPPGMHPHFHPHVAERPVSPVVTEELRRLELPETYLLYHGPSGETELRRLLDAWSWAAEAVGDYYPLLAIGLDEPEQERLAALLAEYELTGTARPVPRISLAALAELYRGCTALFHPLEAAAWGGPLRLALASARPVVGLDTERAAALCGPAAYLARPDSNYIQERRALGAALLTVVVEESMAVDLSRQARQRAAAWSFAAFRSGLQEFYLASAQHSPGEDRHANPGE